MSTTNRLAIVVVGGGPGGLVAATLLAQAGHEVTVVERRTQDAEAEVVEAGQGINLTKNVWTCFAACGMMDDFAHIADFGHECVVKEHTDGSTARRIQTLHGHRFVHRTDLLRLLLRHATAAGATVVRGETVTAARETRGRPVELTLRSGRRLDADLVIGADGIHSHTRSFIPSASPISPRLTGDCTFLVDVPRAAMQKHEPTRTLYAHGTPPFVLWTAPGRSVVAWTMTRHARFHLQMNDHAYGTGAAYGEQQPPPGRRDPRAGPYVEPFHNMPALRARWADFDPALTLLLAETPSVTKWTIAEMPDLPSWSSESGRIVLLGDAAHAFPPFAGQGAAMAIEDATLLATLLARPCPSPDLARLARAYELLRRPRILGVRDMVRRNVRHWAAAAAAAHHPRPQPPSDPDPAVPEGARAAWSSRERYRWIDDYDAVAEAAAHHFAARP